MGKKDTRAILKSIVIVFVTISAGWLSGEPDNSSSNYWGSDLWGLYIREWFVVTGCKVFIEEPDMTLLTSLPITPPKRSCHQTLVLD